MAKKDKTLDALTETYDSEDSLLQNIEYDKLIKRYSENKEGEDKSYSFSEYKSEKNAFTIKNNFDSEVIDRVKSKFSKDVNGYKFPDLLSLQFKSFCNLFKFGPYRKDHQEEILYKIIRKYFPVNSLKDEFILDFVDYKITPPKHSPLECLKNGISYTVSLTVKFRLISKNVVLEQNVYFGEIPYMTESASFIYNGIERVGVMQIEKSTGISFTNVKKGVFSPTGCVCKIIPLVGVWLEFTVSQKMQMYVTFNKKAKVYVTTFLRAIGFKTNYEILNIFDLVDKIDCTKTKELNKCKGRKIAYKITKNNGVDASKAVSNDVIVQHYTVIDDDVIKKIIENGNKEILVLKDDNDLIEKFSILIDSLNADKVSDEDEAYLTIYKLYLTNVQNDNVSTAKSFFLNLFENEKMFDLGYVGRKKINDLSNKKTEKKYKKTLSKDDIKSILSYYFAVINREKDTVDIDHYGNKQIKTVGEKLFELLDVCFQRIARVAKDRVNVCDRSDMNIYSLINCSILTISINSFFATNSLLQFMDATNPLCSLMHKRRVSAGGDGGIDENSTSTEIRDIHYSQYGRICPVVTPEGNTIGIISALAMNSKTDDYGFLLAPYRVVKNGKVELDNSKIVYLNADEELGKKIISFTTQIDKDGNIIEDIVKARVSDDFKLVSRDEVDYMEVIYNQPFSVAASLIPFLENDDSSRALTGTNMLKQAVPLLSPEAPIVATGIETKICQDTRKILYAEGDGVVKYVDANKIIIDYKNNKDLDLLTSDDTCKEYKINKFIGTNQKTCENYRPIVKIGDNVKKGTVLTEGFSTNKGELAIGRNLKVAFVTYKGYNFQDAIVISERLLKDDVFTSIYIEKFNICTKSTKYGNEKITRNINSLSNDRKNFLDENGLVKEGVFVKDGDILVGKTKPKAETYSTPENKLLRAIFGEKSCETVDASLLVPPFTRGTVINTRLFSRREVRKNTKSLQTDLKDLVSKYEEILDVFIKNTVDKFVRLLNGKTANAILHKYGEVLVRKGTKLDKDIIKNAILNTELKSDNINIEFSELHYFRNLEDIIVDEWTSDSEVNKKVVKLVEATFNAQTEILNNFYNEQYAILHGDYLPDELLNKAEVTIAHKRKLRIGDKLSGRHGNKGVISKILKEEDMPFLEDGSRVDIVLTPLGIPSRMNLGQIYETLLGWAGEKLGCKYQTPIFNGYNIETINEELKKAGLPEFGVVQLYDGLTGEKFDQKSTVGVIYMIKLNHMDVDKVHARSIGQYSVITQQPLSGRAHFGGQRFGEMEVWSLEAYGAANLLQEMLTLKSDDIQGRKSAYNSLLEGEIVNKVNIPESFFVLVRELTAIGLRLTFE